MKRRLLNILSAVLAVCMLLNLAAFAENELPEVPVPQEPIEYEYPDDWSRPALVFAVENGVLAGDENHNLNPQANITRAEMAAVLVRLLGASETCDLSAYTDVDASAWYCRELSCAVNAGIFSGVSETSMQPNAPITREQAIVVLSRAFGITDLSRDAYKTFADGSSVSSWARDALSAMKQQGLANGYGDGTFHPQSSITRAEVAQLLFNLFDCIADTPEEIPASGRVLYRGRSRLPASLRLDGTLVIGQPIDPRIVAFDWVVSGSLIVRSGKNTHADFSGLRTGKLVFAPLGGRVNGTAREVYLWGGGCSYYGNTPSLVCIGGAHSAYGDFTTTDLRAGQLTLHGDSEKILCSGSSLAILGQTQEICLSGIHSNVYGDAPLLVCTEGTSNVYGHYDTVDLRGGHLTINGNPGKVNCATNTHFTVTGTADEVYLSGTGCSVNGNMLLLVSAGGVHSASGDYGRIELRSGQLTLSGNAVKIVCAANTHLTVNDGNVQSIDVFEKSTTVDGNGTAKLITVKTDVFNVTLACDKLDDSWYQSYLFKKEHDNALNVVKTQVVPCTVEKDTALYTYQGGGGWIRDLPAGTTVYNEYHPAGYWFYVRCEDGTYGWVPRWDCYIPDDPPGATDFSVDYSDAVKEGFVDLHGYSSKTNYLVWVSRYMQKVVVYTGSKGNWKVLKTFPCSSGANNCPTPVSITEIYLSGDHWNFDFYYVTNVTLFNGDIAFHSILYNYDGSIYDGTLGYPASHGCIRMSFADSAYMETLPIGTTVVVY